MKNRNSVLDYTEALYYDENQSNKGKILSQKEIEQGDFHKLDDFIEQHLIPTNIRYKSVDGTFSKEEAHISLFNIVYYNFCREEIEYIISYLKKKGITVVSKKVVRETKKVYGKENFAYFDIAYHNPLLDQDDQSKLLEEYKKNPSPAIRNQLLLANMRIIYYTLNYFISYNQIDKTRISLRELEEVGLDSLFKAIETFKIEKDCKFQTYASNIIYNSYYTYFERKLLKKNLLTNFNEARLVVEEKLGIKLCDNFSIFEDILAYMQEAEMLVPRDYEIAKESILKTLRKYYLLGLNESNIVLDDASDEEIDYNLLITRLREYLNSNKEIFEQSLNDLILNLGLDGMERVSGINLSKGLNISRAAISRRIRNLEKEISSSSNIDKLFDPELLDYYRSQNDKVKTKKNKSK